MDRNAEQYIQLSPDEFAGLRDEDINNMGGILNEMYDLNIALLEDDRVWVSPIKKELMLAGFQKVSVLPSPTAAVKEIALNSSLGGIALSTPNMECIVDLSFAGEVQGHHILTALKAASKASHIGLHIHSAASSELATKDFMANFESSLRYLQSLNYDKPEWRVAIASKDHATNSVFGREELENMDILGMIAVLGSTLEWEVAEWWAEGGGIEQLVNSYVVKKKSIGVGDSSSEVFLKRNVVLNLWEKHQNGKLIPRDQIVH